MVVPPGLRAIISVFIFRLDSGFSFAFGPSFLPWTVQHARLGDCNLSARTLNRKAIFGSAPLSRHVQPSLRQVLGKDGFNPRHGPRRV